MSAGILLVGLLTGGTRVLPGADFRATGWNLGSFKQLPSDTWSFGTEKQST